MTRVQTIQYPESPPQLLRPGRDLTVRSTSTPAVRRVRARFYAPASHCTARDISDSNPSRSTSKSAGAVPGSRYPQSLNNFSALATSPFQGNLMRRRILRASDHARQNRRDRSSSTRHAEKADGASTSHPDCRAIRHTSCRHEADIPRRVAVKQDGNWSRRTAGINGKAVEGGTVALRQERSFHLGRRMGQSVRAKSAQVSPLLTSTWASAARPAGPHMRGRNPPTVLGAPPDAALAACRQHAEIPCWP